MLGRVVKRGERILRVPLGVVDADGHDPSSAAWTEFIQIFTRRGYTLQPGAFNPTNRREVGIVARTQDAKTHREAQRKLAEDLGLDMPRQLTSPEEIVSSIRPLVAKVITAHQGEQKYLLRKPESKIKFLAIALLKDPEALLQEQDIHKRNAVISELMEKVSQRDFSDPRFKSEADNFVVEEYIETPSNRYTSFRIVVDARGKIGSELLLYSRNSKDHIVIRSPIGPFSGYDRFFKNSSMASFIFATSFVSNASQGGNQINLVAKRALGEAVTAEEEILLEAHGLNKIRPRLPKDLMRKVRIIGKASRGDFPFVGVDFILGTDGKYYLLEINNSPGIDDGDVAIGRRTQQHVFENSILGAPTKFIAHKLARRI